MDTIIADKFAEVKKRFSTLFDLFETLLNGQRDQELHALRRKAINRLADLSFPTRRDEDWKYTSVSRILALQFQDAPDRELKESDIRPFLFSGLEAYRLVFVNGKYHRSLSSAGEKEAGLTIMSLGEALSDKRFRETAGAYYREWAERDANPFVALNAAFAKSGTFIHVEKNRLIKKPVHLLYINTKEEEPVFVNPQLLVVGERSSRLTVVESHRGSDQKSVYFSNVLNRLLLKENAVINHYKLQHESRSAYQISNSEAHQYRDSAYSSFAIDLGGRLVRNNLSSILNAEGTMTHLRGIYMADGNQHVDNQTFMDHAFPHCNSNELYKGIIDGQARGVFNGKVTVRPDAQKTNAFQQNSSLVLSETALMDSKPQLEIFADDVKCSHGATIGQLEEEAIYYLRSRGLNEEAAKALLQMAFLKEVLEHLPLAEIREYVEKLIDERFK